MKDMKKNPDSQSPFNLSIFKTWHFQNSGKYSDPSLICNIPIHTSKLSKIPLATKLVRYNNTFKRILKHGMKDKNRNTYNMHFIVLYSWHKVWPTKIELLMDFSAEVANDDKKDGNIWITF